MSRRRTLFVLAYGLALVACGGKDSAGEADGTAAETDARAEARGSETVGPDACKPSCQDRECGDDGCGGSCGKCKEWEVCTEGESRYCCNPDCEGHECGDDGCGGICGQCSDGEMCDTNYESMVRCCTSCEVQCVNHECGGMYNDCWPDVAGLYPCDCGTCGEDEVCAHAGGYCDGPENYGCETKCVPEAQVCGGVWLCKQGEVCIDGWCVLCSPDCMGKECGDNGCGVSCGDCDEQHVCQQGQCVLQPWCGDGVCDKELSENCLACPADCGCGAGNVCVDGTCCLLQCDGKECGPDGCGGTCGECPANHLCTIEAQCVCIPDCKDKECGNDGCGGSCGECQAPLVCGWGGECGPPCVPDEFHEKKCDGVDNDCDGQTDWAVCFPCQPCKSDGNCVLGHCNVAPDGETFCAASTTSCVFLDPVSGECQEVENGKATCVWPTQPCICASGFWFCNLPECSGATPVCSQGECT